MENNFETYLFRGERVVLLYDTEVAYWSPLVAPLAYGGEYNPYPLVDDITRGIRCGMLHPHLCYDDSYANDCLGEYTGEVEIVYTQVRDIESPLYLTEEYVTKLFAVLDNAQRELAITTDEWSEWHSEREHMVDEVRELVDEDEYEALDMDDLVQRLQALRDSWKKVIEEGGYDKAILDAIAERESYPFNGYVADAKNYVFTPLAESVDCSFASILDELNVYTDIEF